MGLFSEGEEGGKENLLQKAEEGKLKALYLVGEETSFSTTSRGKSALEKLPLLIVQDLFMTETAQMAHVVLPACSFVEKEGTFTNLERRIQKLNPLRPPLYQSKSDFDIFLSLLRLFEYSIPGETPEAIFEAIRHDLPHYRDTQEGEQWPKGSPYLYSDGFPLGKAKLIPLEGKNHQPPPQEYPFHLIQKTSLFQSGFLSSKSDALKTISEKSYLEMNPGDAHRLNIEEGETVKISTPQGRSSQIKVKYSSKPIPGVIIAPYPCSLIEEERFSQVKVERLK